MTEDTINLLESAIHITKERDKKSLALALVEIIADYLDFHSVLLLDIPPVENLENLEVSSYVCLDESRSRNYQRPDIEVPYDDLMKSAIKENRVVSETLQDATRTIFPILIKEKPIGLLVVYHNIGNPPNEKLIHGFLSIYSNFTSILHDNERDTLTGLLNRKTFDSLISDLFSNIPINQEKLKDSADERESAADTYHWLAELDIDHFKNINDSFGHLYGDEVLMMFANLMGNSFRKQDLLFRYGGEEFIVAITKATEADARMVLERFRTKLEAFDFPQVGKVTVSIGVAKILAGTDPSVAIEQADKALYYSKENGRNQISNYHDLLEADKIT